MKTVGYIARGLTKGGVTRYIENHLQMFNTKYFEDYNFIIFTDDKSFIDKYKNLKVVYIPKTFSKIIWDYLYILFYFKKFKLNTVIYPKNIIPLTHILFKFKKVNIITDLAYFSKEFNEYKFFDTLYMKLFMKLSCKLADKVLAISQNTKNDLINILNIRESKIEVMYLGVESRFQKNLDEKSLQVTIDEFNIQKPFLFYCGSLSPRKNILRVMQAFNSIKDEIPHNFYITSGQSWSDKEVLDYISENLQGRVFLLGKIKENDIINMYSLADIFIFVSLYEGFGLPILEAQSCECPVITSNKTSCPEIAGDSAKIINPYSVEDIAKAILDLLKNKEERDNLIKKGLENTKKFSWQYSAEILLKNVWKRILF